MTFPQSAQKAFIAAVCLLTAFLFDACQEPKPEPSRQERIADTFCQCTQQLLALNKEAEGMLQDTSKTRLLQEQMRIIQDAYQSARDCAGNIIARHGKITNSDLPLLQTALSGKCPELANQTDLIRELLGE